MIAFDAEYTSLKDMRLVSFALVPVEEDSVKVNKSVYIIVSQKNVGSSAKIHGIVGDIGINEEEALTILYNHIINNILIVYTTIDIQFLKNKFGKKVKGVKYIDVAKAYISYMSRKSWLDTELQKGLDLETIAKKLNIHLTDFIFHNALLDAIHTALIYIKLKKIGIKMKMEKI
ncbi:Exonuclease [Pyrobaculum oguniense TE7]|uniref:Exonuclease n=1 Tax=Pyrobaculum oguniense (strain DSM 13380 / JCM 10595 / TE7) TaxID=698757 RepID=H6QAF9_PYROT|nr:Exonuclease [Pyrobaculum oguniense TE7]